MCEFQTSTTNSILGHEIQSTCGVINATIAISKDITVRSGDSFFGNFGAIKNIIKQGHGINNDVSQSFDDLYRIVTARLIQVASDIGCNGIIGMKYDIHTVDDYFILTAYGTACVVQ